MMMVFDLPDHGKAMTSDEISAFTTYKACIKYPKFKKNGWEKLYNKHMSKVIKVINLCGDDLNRLYILLRLDLRDYNLVDAVAELSIDNLVRCPKAIAVSKYLNDLIPDADPIYLDLAGEMFVYDKEGLLDFIEQITAAKKSYPKLLAYDEFMKKLALIKELTLDFHVERFFEICGDPVKFMLDVNTDSKAELNNDKLQYLFDRFYEMSITTIKAEFNEQHCNVLCTIKSLEANNYTKLRKPRTTWPSGHVSFLCTSDNIDLLKEIAFIEFTDAILFHINIHASQRQYDIALATQNGSLYTCECCLNDMLLDSEKIVCPQGHCFCHSCIKKYIEIQVSANNLEMKCLNHCNEEYSLEMVESILDEKIFNRITRLKQVKDIKAANIEGLEDCAFCDYSVVVPPTDKVITCLNPDCRKKTCRSCRGECHIPYRCDEIEKAPEVEIRTMIENKMSEALIRTCPKCNNKFLKETGCNRMTCNCGLEICYICRKVLRSHYSHFYHDRRMANKCPLYTEENITHVAAVEAAARLIINELKVTKPELLKKVDISKLLPAIKTRSSEDSEGPGPSVFNNNEVIAKIIGEKVEKINRLHIRSIEPPPKKPRNN